MDKIEYYAFIIITIICIFFGATCNILVMGFNDGKMHVKLNYTFQGDKHFGYYNDDEVILPQLSDKYIVVNRIFSLGDFIMFINLLVLLFVLVYYGVKHRKKKKCRGK